MMIGYCYSKDGRRLSFARAEGDIVLSVSFHGVTHTIIPSELDLEIAFQELSNSGKSWIRQPQTRMEMKMLSVDEVMVRICPHRETSIEDDPETSVYFLQNLKNDLFTT